MGFIGPVKDRVMSGMGVGGIMYRCGVTCIVCTCTCTNHISLSHSSVYIYTNIECIIIIIIIIARHLSLIVFSLYFLSL